MARHLCSLNQIQNSIVNNYHHAKILRVKLVVVVVLVVVWYWAKPAAVENKTKSVLSHTYSCVLMFTLHKKLRYQCFLAEQQVGYNCSEVQFFFSTMHIYLWENAVYIPFDLMFGHFYAVLPTTASTEFTYALL